jgi:hypothetical protein
VRPKGWHFVKRKVLLIKKELLSQDVIRGCISGTDAGKENHTLVIVLASIAFVIGALVLYFPVATLLCWGFSALCIVLLLKSQSLIRSIQKKEYVLQEELCVNKGISTSSEGPDSPYLVFSQTGRVYTNFPHVIWNSKAMCATGDVYQTTQIGDTVYLLRVKKQVLYVFSQRFWEIDETDFSQKENLFLPNE